MLWRRKYFMQLSHRKYQYWLIMKKAKAAKASLKAKANEMA
jgi:hypothetical protein